MVDVLVLGAGATGLACGHSLAEAGVDVTVLEAADRPGGAIGTVQQDGFLFEAGPSSIQASARTFRELCGELGLADKLLVSRESARTRYLFHRGRLRALPKGPLSLCTTGLLSVGSKLRLMIEPLRRRTPLSEGRMEPSFEALMAERLGIPAARTLAGAFVRGVYAAEAGQLGAASAFPKLWALVQEHGGLVRGMIGGAKARKLRNEPDPPGPDCRRSDLLSLPGGLGELTGALAEALGSRLRLSTRIERLESTDNGFRAHLAGGETIEAARVVVALGAAETVRVCGGLLEGLDLALLERLTHASVTVVHLGLANAPCPDGFGFLVPPGEPGIRALGVLFPARIFDGRAPEGQDSITAIYRTADLSDEDGREVAAADMCTILGTRPEVATSKVLSWQEVIPRYGIGHAPRAARLVADASKKNPGLSLAGNFHGGISVDDCLTRGRSAARSIAVEPAAETSM